MNRRELRKKQREEEEAAAAAKAAGGDLEAGEKQEGSNLDDKPSEKDTVVDNAATERDGLLQESADEKGTARRNRAAGGGKSKGPENEEDDIENQNANRQSGTNGPLRVLEPLRQDPVKALVSRQKRLDRLPVEGIPEVHYVGQICSGQGLMEDTTEGVCVRWRVDTGKAWQHLGGNIQGQTQISYCKARDTEDVPFNHPIDLHFAEAGLQGWGAPRISFQAYRLDWTGRRILVGYGFEHLPTAPGTHKMKVCLWRPTGSKEQELSAYLLGSTPALVNHEPLYDSAWRERCRLVTIPAGSVRLDLNVLTRNMKQVGVDAQSV